MKKTEMGDLLLEVEGGEDKVSILKEKIAKETVPKVKTAVR